MYGIAGEHLTTNVRKELMEGIIYKQLSWFDSETKAPGMLTNIMAEDMSALNGMTTETISVVIQGALGMALALLMALYFSWRTALFTLLASPILFIGVFGMSRL
jgi:ABC-type multidrug transport system fused ATPase/permease subunit